jgi:excisionase family DNA binding protein
MSEQHQLTVPEAEKRTGIPSRTLRHAIQNAWLCAEKKGRDWLIKETDLVAYLNSERKPGPKPKSLLSLLSLSAQPENGSAAKANQPMAAAAQQ